jgi:hypothetical protein
LLSFIGATFSAQKGGAKKISHEVVAEPKLTPLTNELDLFVPHDFSLTETNSQAVENEQKENNNSSSAAEGDLQHEEINPSNVTVRDVNELLECLRSNTLAPARLMHLVNRLVPFAKSVAGSAIFLKTSERYCIQKFLLRFITMPHGVILLPCPTQTSMKNICTDGRSVMGTET